MQKSAWFLTPYLKHPDKNAYKGILEHSDDPWNALQAEVQRASPVDFKMKYDH